MSVKPGDKTQAGNFLVIFDVVCQNLCSKCTKCTVQICNVINVIHLL